MSLLDAVPIHKATIIPRGQALGMVTQLPDRDVVSISKAQLLARMDVAMGGRVAEEIVFGKDHVTTGASSDFEQATAIARAMVCQYGMSDQLGAISISDQSDYDLLAPSTRTTIDAEVKSMLDASHQRATKIIQDGRRELEMLAKALVEYETLTREEIVRLLEKRRSNLDHLIGP